MTRAVWIIMILSIFGSNIAYSFDLTVTVSGSPHCNDGIDNDGDTLTDYPDDPGCSSLTDENEIDPLPFCGDNICNGSETCSSCSSDCGSCPATGGGGGGGGSSSGQSYSSLNSVVFRGVAYPGSKVTILKDGVVAATTQAGPDAKFEIIISDLPAKTYVFGTWAEDKNKRRSATYTFTVAVTQGITTSVSGIFVSPTIATDKKEVKRGDIIQIFGQATPNSNVDIFINSENEILKKTKSDVLGSWLYKFNSSEVEYGDHTTKSRISYDDDLSQDSKIVNFKVGNKNVLSVQDDTYHKVDFNKDDRVNLVDFSMMAYWYKRPLPKKEFDLNSDGVVNLVDFSIMAFYWTG